ncbi:hypothetical protein P9112_000980 [Eukaryota sp. TZLM1-RC]
MNLAPLHKYVNSLKPVSLDEKTLKDYVRILESDLYDSASVLNSTIQTLTSTQSVLCSMSDEVLPTFSSTINTAIRTIRQNCTTILENISKSSEKTPHIESPIEEKSDEVTESDASEYESEEDSHASDPNCSSYSEPEPDQEESVVEGCDE